ncbi:MAG: hypothetical protein Q9227_003996 [Pyrenula ochraceoflavens]
MAAPRPATPPAPSGPSAADSTSPLTPEHVRQREINRLKAKALQQQREKDQNAPNPPSLSRSASQTAGTKRSYTTFSETPSNQRDARNSTPTATQNAQDRPLDAIRPARSFTKYVEYDLSKITDTKGGFLTQEDDPHNKALHSDDTETKPAGMTLKDWERQRLLKSLRNQKAGPFEPGITSIKHEKQKTCRECGTLEIDFKWDETFRCQVCNTCKEKHPDKYSLLTKTEAKADYLLTDPELRDEDLLPHMERPNPHKSTWNNMMLFLRYQVEEYAFSDKRWGSGEALDAEYERREAEKKRRKENKFKAKLQDLKKRTRVEAYKRSRAGGGGGGGGKFGEDLGGGGKHVHEWGRTVENPETGIGVKTCMECGMEVEELEF